MGERMQPKKIHSWLYWPLYGLCAGVMADTSFPFPVVEMAPDQHWVLRLDPRYATFDEEFNAEGVRQTAPVKSTYDYIRFIAAYGVNDDLTLGVIAPYGRLCSEPHGDLAAPSVPVIAQSLGYDVPDKQCRNEMGDTIVGSHWRFYKTVDTDWVLGSGISVGIAPKDDPDDLIDVHLGEGNNGIILQVENFSRWQNGFDTRFLLKNTIQLKDDIDVRIPTTSGGLIAPAVNRTRVDRNLGDSWEVDLELGKTIGNWRVATTWYGYKKFADDYSGSVNGFSADNLEADTEELRYLWGVSLSWHSATLWKQKQFPVPMVADLELQKTYDGKNTYAVDRLYMTVKILL